MTDIESRFIDHLDDIKLFVLQPGEDILMQPVDLLLSVPDRPVEGFAQAFPTASFEIEESAKCCALNRYTASIFHCMRALECGIRAMSRFLDMPDAAKAGGKNWGAILKALRGRVDEKWPMATRTENSIGARMESLLATLDAMKNPWRNATMHVETIYAPHEAIHIVRCSGVFLIELARFCDEEGREPQEAPAMADVEDESEA